MAEVDFDEFEDAVSVPVRDGARAAMVNRLMNYAGAASSIILVILLAVWGYKLLLRDVNGVPVMRAIEGPMRVAPSDPGGQEASNQGLSVNAVASTGIASKVPDKLVLAPQATPLAADDPAGLAAAPGAEAGAAAVLPPLTISGTGSVTDAAGSADAGANAVDPVSAAVAAAVAEDPGNGLARSLIPRPRPGNAVRTGSAAAAAPVEVDAATIAVGTRMAQLGVFDLPEAARAKWDQLAAQYAEVMTGKSMVVEPAVSGGKTFYRLRALGFDTEDDTRSFCAVLTGGNSDCIPVAQR